jgi:hypothetical protein
VVPFEPGDVQRGRDPQLDAALGYLRAAANAAPSRRP